MDVELYFHKVEHRKKHEGGRHGVEFGGRLNNLPLTFHRIPDIKYKE